jgi:hypothetical protein
LADRSITPYMRTRDSIHRKNSPYYGPERFTYQPEHNRYICPAGQPLTMVVEFIGIAPTTTSEPASVVVRARRNRNAPVQRSGLLSSTGTSRLGNGHESWRTRQSSRLHSGKEEGGSLIRGTQESDWAAALAPAEIEVRAGAVLPGSGSPKHQAAHALPQLPENTGSASHHLAELRKEEIGRGIPGAKDVLLKY